LSEHNKVSNLIKSQVPFFVRNDHEQFVKFLEKYYEYLEQDEKTVRRAKTIRELNDIDVSPDEFAEHLYNTFMQYIPKNIETDKRLLLKHIKDFYRAKGTEKSIRFLMNALFHAQSSFYYPKVDVLRASDGKWYIQRSLRVSDTKINGVANSSISGLERYVGTRIIGATSNASATVERVERIFDQGTQVDEIVLSNIDGEFENGETIQALFDDVEATSNISSNIFSGLINTITINNGGEGYQVGDPAIIVSSVGEGAVASVAQVTTGNIVSIAVLTGGAGYRANDDVLIISGGPGSGASARVDQTIQDERYHPNTYNIMASQISLEANTPLGNTVYSNLNMANANVSLQNATNFWQYANTGPAGSVIVLNSGQNYTTPPSLSIIPNTAILGLGILGRMEIYDGGINYEIGDVIDFVNIPGCLGTGAQAKVSNVDSNGSITEVTFTPLEGHIIGGSGYNILPGVHINSANGTGANVRVTATLGQGATLRSDQSTIGSITRIVVSSRGRNYDQNTTIDLTQSGNGNANASVTVLEGIITYPGRWLNDDGQLDSYNFLQDRDFYQSFSYVVRSNVPISKFRSILKNLTHPAGTKLFGEFVYDVLAANTAHEIGSTDTSVLTGYASFYEATGNSITFLISENTYNTAISYGNVFVEFANGALFGNTDLYEIVDNGEDLGQHYITVVGSENYPNTNGIADLYFSN
jgi:hypothetical protein